MNEYEQSILEKACAGCEPSFDVKYKYSDEFYVKYVSLFQTERKNKMLYIFIKRVFDITLSLLSLILLFIPFLIIMIIIRIDSKGHAIFKNIRVGKNGKTFKCWKFRTMSITAPENEATSVFTDAEKYITKVGRFLRKTSLDELPQLVNVLLGQMSIIGYRPLVLSENNCNQMRNQLGVLKMKPGISGYAQIKGRDDVYYKNKAILDAYYVKKASLSMDFNILLKTITIVLTRKGNQDNE